MSLRDGRKTKRQKREGREFLQGTRWSQALELAKPVLRPGDGEEISQWEVRIRRSESGGHRETETREQCPPGPQPPPDRTERRRSGRCSQVAPRAASPASPANSLDMDILRPHSGTWIRTLGVGPWRWWWYTIKPEDQWAARRPLFPLHSSYICWQPQGKLVRSTPQACFLRLERKMPEAEQWEWRAGPSHLRWLSNTPFQGLPLTSGKEFVLSAAYGVDLGQ